MNLEFRKTSEFEKGTIYSLLKDAYSFDANYEKTFNQNWLDFDSFFFSNPDIADNYGFITVLDGIPIGLVSWNPQHRPDYVEIGHNCIATKYKGNGYGKRQLLEAVTRIKKYSDLQKIIVTTNDNLIAKFNYQSVGFHLTKRTACNLFFGDYLLFEIDL